MLSNLFFRLNQLMTRWLYHNHRRYKNMEPSDD